MSDDKRYRVLRWKDARSAVNSEVYARDYDVEDNCYLIDGQSNEIIYADGSQMDCPEDMILTRNLEFFVDRMNKLTAASEQARKQAEAERDRYRGLLVDTNVQLELWRRVDVNSRNKEAVYSDLLSCRHNANRLLDRISAALTPTQESQDAS